MAKDSMATKAHDVRENPALQRIAGISAWTQEVLRSIELVAVHQSSVLIIGPSGTGKELIARAIHACSRRATRPFIPVDCAVTTGTLFASHMFGHVKGSFTGATAATLGCFRAADTGTIFLDEIGEMELELQAKLLRVLQQRVVVPVGSHQEIPVDVRVLAATNRDLATEVEAGRFREDLFYRLNVVTIRTLGLRQRPEDIPVLAERYLAELAARHGMPMCALSPPAIELLQAYAWPGNVRELENVLERAVMFSSGDEIDPDALSGLMGNRSPAVRSPHAHVPEAHLPEAGSPAGIPATASSPSAAMATAASQGIVAPTALPGVYRVEPRIDSPPVVRPTADVRVGGPSGLPAATLKPTSPQDAPGDSAAAAADGWPTLADVERMHLERTLAATMQNKSLAAKLLGIDRSVLRRKLQRYGLDDGPGDAAIPEADISDG
jgi:DNA-binding NtrC family response regulator